MLYEDVTSVPFRAVHAVWGEGTVTRTESTGQGRTRRPIFVPDAGYNLEGRCLRASWAGLEPLEFGESRGESSSVQIDGDEATIVWPTTRKPKLGDIDDLIRERGLDPDEWVVVTVGLNEWDGMTAPQYDPETDEKRNKTIRLKQWKVTLRRKPHIVLAIPAVHVPKVRNVPGPPPSERPELIVVEGDHHAPYHDEDLHLASLSMLEDLSKNHRLAEHVFLGDTGDYPTISRHADHPAAAALANECIQGSYEVLRDKREVAPQARARKLKGNHDWRLESELLARAERLYDIKPADTATGVELPALSLRRLLHLDAIGVELVEHPMGWEHAEIELVPGTNGLVARHGWLVGQNTAQKSLAKRGRSIIVGHKHTREHVFMWDPSAGVERQGVVCAIMCQRDKRFGHYAPLNDWAQGLVTVTRWPDGGFEIEHARWNGECLSWRDRRYA